MKHRSRVKHNSSYKKYCGAITLRPQLHYKLKVICKNSLLKGKLMQ